MPPKKNTRLAQMLIKEQRERGMTDHAVAMETGVQQQTFSTWKRGSVPREPFRATISRFLRITPEMMEELCEEAKASQGSSVIPRVAALGAIAIQGRVSDRKKGIFKFDDKGAPRGSIPVSRYSIVIDTSVMEPALPVGCQAWVDPSTWPEPGNDVVVHGASGRAWVGQLMEMSEGSASIRQHSPHSEFAVSGVQAVHVITMSTRIKVA